MVFLVRYPTWKFGTPSLVSNRNCRRCFTLSAPTKSLKRGSSVEPNILAGRMTTSRALSFDSTLSKRKRSRLSKCSKGVAGVLKSTRVSIDRACTIWCENNWPNTRMPRCWISRCPNNQRCCWDCGRIRNSDESTFLANVATARVDGGAGPLKINSPS